MVWLLGLLSLRIERPDFSKWRGRIIGKIVWVGHAVK
jgi:hypothetical protein